MPVTIMIAAYEDLDDVVAALVRLVPQLSSSNPPPTRMAVEEIVGAGATEQFIARDEDGTIVGVSTLVVFRIPTGVRAWIEDVIVDETARGQGIGDALTRAMIVRAAERCAVTVDLTSRPGREAANRLYQRVGFELRTTKVYRFVVPPVEL